MSLSFEKTEKSIAKKLRTGCTSQSSPARGVRIRSPILKDVSIQVGKRGGEVGKMMNSGRERERRRKIKGKNGFAVLAVLGSKLKQKGCGSGLSTSSLSGLIKINPLGRNQQSARAVSVSKLSFRPTLTSEWEVFRSPNQVILESISHGIKLPTQPKSQKQKTR